MKTGIIYIAINKINKKCYIGLTSNSLEERIKQHIKDRKRFKYKFYNALNKYGINNFKWKILYKNVSFNKLSNLEILTIAKYNSYKEGYNSTPGGDISPMHDFKIRRKVSIALSGKNNPMYGKIYTNKEKLKLSKLLKGMPKSEETKMKMSRAHSGKNNPFYGKTHSFVSKLKMKEKRAKRIGKLSPNYGKHWSQSTKNKISKSLFGRKRKPLSEATKKKISMANKGRPPWNKKTTGS